MAKGVWIIEVALWYIGHHTYHIGFLDSVGIVLREVVVPAKSLSHSTRT